MSGAKVTPDDLNAVIAHEFYFTAGDGATAAHVLHGANDTSLMSVLDELELLTICVLVLQNGFKLVGISSCVDAANFDAEKGKQLAREDAVNKLWPLLGYQLKERLFQSVQPPQPPDVVMPTRATAEQLGVKNV